MSEDPSGEAGAGCPCLLAHRVQGVAHINRVLVVVLQLVKGEELPKGVCV